MIREMRTRSLFKGIIALKYLLIPISKALMENGRQSDSTPAGASPENHDYFTLIEPHRRSPRYHSQEVDVNVRKEIVTVRENITQPTVKKPKDKTLSEFEEEIAKFRIAAGAPKRLKKYPKKKKRQQPQTPVKSGKKIKNDKVKQKPVLEELDEALEFDFDDDEQKNKPSHEEGEEEEEETEEKKEKIHKVTIKKKIPRKNVTGIIRHQRQQPLPPYQLPYKTIIREKEKIVTRKRKPPPPSSEMLKIDTKPLILKENVENLNPNFYHDKNVRKAIKPRDVNVFLRTRNTNPKILIRRYKPFFSVVNIPIIKPNKHSGGLKKQLRKQKRRQRRRRKRLRKQRERDEDFSPESSKVEKQVSCSTERIPERYAHSNSFPVFGSTGGGTGNSPYDSIYASFPAIKPESISIPEESNPFSNEYQHFPSGSFFAIQQRTTSKPLGIIKTDEVVAEDDEPIQTAYDVRGHKNTETLAALHEKETDDTVDNEEEEPHFVDDTNAAIASDAEAEADDGENAETEVAPDQYENEEGESNPHWKLIYGYQPQKLVKKIRNAGV